MTEEMVLIKTNWKYHKSTHVKGKTFTMCGKRANKMPWKSIPRQEADASGWTPCSMCYSEDAK